MTVPASSWAILPAGELVAWVEDREAAARGLSRHDRRLMAEDRLRLLLEELHAPADLAIQTRYAPSLCRIEAFVPANLWRVSSRELEVEEGGLIPVEALVLAARDGTD